MSPCGLGAATLGSRAFSEPRAPGTASLGPGGDVLRKCTAVSLNKTHTALQYLIVNFYSLKRFLFLPEAVL